jgi:hypothetical protein
MMACGQIFGKVMTAAVASGLLKSSPSAEVKLPRIKRRGDAIPHAGRDVFSC